MQYCSVDQVFLAALVNLPSNEESTDASHHKPGKENLRFRLTSTRMRIAQLQQPHHKPGKENLRFRLTSTRMRIAQLQQRAVITLRWRLPVTRQVV